MKRFFFVLCLVPVCYSIFAEPGDELIVKDDLVNLRDGPSLENEVLLRLDKNTRLIEIDRNDKWIEVKTDSENTISGWIHSSLVKKTVQAKSVNTPGKEELLATAFEKFRKEFEKMSARMELEFGQPVFTGIEYAGNGTVRVVVTDTWLDINRVLQEKHLADIFGLWEREVAVGLPASVDIVNSDNERIAMMFR